MNDLAISVLSVLLTTGSPMADQWRAAAAVEEEFVRLLDEEEGALADVDRWIEESESQTAGADGSAVEDLSKRIDARLEEVTDGYETFLEKHPEHVEGLISYGHFLSDMGEESSAAEQWEKARQLDPEHPVPWNDLANYYGHSGGVTNAFPYYEKAIELDPYEPVYYQNLATTVYSFRQDAQAYYGLDLQQIFDKAIELYRKGLELSPGSYPAAYDLALTYYGIQPFRLEDAKSAWKQALDYAGTEEERQNVFIHLARLEIEAGQESEASDYLDRVTLPQLNDLKERLLRRMDQTPPGDNAPPE